MAYAFDLIPLERCFSFLEKKDEEFLFHGLTSPDNAKQCEPANNSKGSHHE
jgi:hypothetical protein